VVDTVIEHNFPFTLELSSGELQQEYADMGEEMTGTCPACSYECPLPTNIAAVYAFNCICGKTGVAIRTNDGMKVRYDVQEEAGAAYLVVDDHVPVDLRLCNRCDGAVQPGDRAYIVGRTYLTQTYCPACVRMEGLVETRPSFGESPI